MILFKDSAVLMYGILSEIIVTRLNFLDIFVENDQRADKRIQEINNVTKLN